MSRNKAFPGPRFSEKLLAWYAANKRDLPWRRTRDPYAIWISEIMLQQTQVGTVIPYYEKFLKVFPDIQSLASAPLEKVLKSWEGLGYYSRARNLHLTAREVRAKYDGKIPETSEALIGLPGIGPYTASAISSIAYGEPSPVVDGNVWRVFSRMQCLAGPIEKGKDELRKFLREMIPHSKASSFNQAVMELGALICTPANPECGSCPVSGHCSAYKKNCVEKFPEAPPKKSLPHRHWAAIVLKREKKVLLRRRPLRGLWGGLWEFPTVPVGKRGNPFQSASKYLMEMNVEADELKPLEPIRHAFTHFKLTLHPFQARLAGRMPQASLAWVDPAAIRHPLPVPHLKILRKFLDLEQITDATENDAV